MNTIQNVKADKPTENTPTPSNFSLGKSITDYFASVNKNTQTNKLMTAQTTNELTPTLMNNTLFNAESTNSLGMSKPNQMAPGKTPELAEDVEDLTESASALGPMVVASSITSGLIHANNQQRDVNAQRSPDFDAQHIAGLQDSRDETVGEVGMLGTAALGATMGPVGVAIGALGTGIAESLDTVSSNQTMSTAGTMTNAALGT